MAYKASPAYQLYPADWLSSAEIELMIPEQEGAFHRLLCHAWLDPDCSIPTDDEKLAKLSRLYERWDALGTAVKAEFVPHPTKPGKLVNPRQIRELKKQKAYSRKMRKNAKKLWEENSLPSKPRHSRTDATLHGVGNASHSLSHSQFSSSNKKENNNICAEQAARTLASPQPGPEKQKRIRKPRQQKYTSEDFNRAKEHLLKTYKLTGGEYPFSASDAGILGLLLRSYDLPKCLALLDLYWQDGDEWTHKSIGRNLKGLMHDRAKLMDNPRLKILESKYRGEIKSNIPINFNAMPQKENSQTRKVDALKHLEAQNVQT